MGKIDYIMRMFSDSKNLARLNISKLITAFRLFIAIFILRELSLINNGEYQPIVPENLL